MDATRGGEVTADLRAARVNAVGAGGAGLMLHNRRYELEGGQDGTAKPCVRMGLREKLRGRRGRCALPENAEPGYARGPIKCDDAVVRKNCRAAARQLHRARQQFGVRCVRHRRRRRPQCGPRARRKEQRTRERERERGAKRQAAKSHAPLTRIYYKASCTSSR